MKKEFHTNHYNHKIEKSIGKPYSQQMGRKAGKGAGHIVQKLSLSDFKRDMQIGTKLKLVERHGEKVDMPVREIVHTQSNAIALESKTGEEGKKSWLAYPKANDIDYDGENIVIYGQKFNQETGQKIEGEKTPVLKYKVISKVEKAIGKPYSQQPGRKTGRGAGHITPPVTLTQSEKIGMSIKEIAKEVRTRLGEEYPECKFSIQKESYSMGASLHLSLMEAPFEAFKDPGPEDADIGSGYRSQTPEQIAAEKEYAKKKGNAQLNPYYLKDDYRLTEEAKAVMQRAIDITNEYNYDNSDPQTDYFDVHFYGHFNIGKWDKPFVKTGDKQIVQGQTRTELVGPEDRDYKSKVSPKVIEQLAPRPVSSELTTIAVIKPPVAKLTTSDRIKLDKPIEVWENKEAGWKWKVWKKYQKPLNEATNEYARWFCSVSSPMTMGGVDMGDVYVKEIKENAVKTFDENEIGKAIGKPYSQQPGRTRGTGAGHIGEEIDLPGEIMDESVYLEREQLKEDLAREAQGGTVPRYKEMVFDPGTFRQVASQYKNGWEFMELMGGDEAFNKIWQFGADHGWIAPTDRTHGALLQISYQILPWAQKANNDEIAEFQQAIFGPEVKKLADLTEVIPGVIDTLGENMTYASLEQALLDMGYSEQDASDAWEWIREKYGE